MRGFCTRALSILALVLIPAPATEGAETPRAGAMDVASAERFARLALGCVEREYPNKIAHVLEGPTDAKPPRELTPSFYGCYDWHSAVHGHWLLARLARQFPQAAFAAEARAALAANLTIANITGEVAYLDRASRVSFERPYGLAWLLQLTSELRSWKDPQAQALGASPRAPGIARREADPGVAPQTPPPDPRRRARSDRLRLRPDPGLGGNRQRRSDDRAASQPLHRLLRK